MLWIAMEMWQMWLGAPQVPCRQWPAPRELPRLLWQLRGLKASALKAVLATVLGALNAVLATVLGALQMPRRQWWASHIPATRPPAVL